MNKTLKPVIKRPALGALKPMGDTHNDDNSSSRLNKLEKLASEQIEEICELRRQLLAEKSKNMGLEQQIEEMTQFLEDYGLKWVGGPRPADPTFEHGPTDMKRFMEQISELNNLAEDNKVKFTRSGNIATMSHQKTITLDLFDFGFTLNGGEMREYDLPINIQFFKDIMDGFYPAEFKTDFPEGVKMKVEDKRTKNLNFKGQGRQCNQVMPVGSNNNKSDLELLPPPSDIGEGDGNVKVRIPSLPDVIMHVTKDLLISELITLISDSFDIYDIKLATPMSVEPLKNDDTMEQAGLYPRGFVMVLH